MAAKRCIPTDLFYNRKFVRLRNDTVRLILIGLITDADDAGRGIADSDLLGRKLDQRSENIQEALEDLEHAGFVQRYTQGEETYYFLCHWYKWEKLGKPTPSRYPAPPQKEPQVSPQDSPGKPGATQGSPNIPEDARSEEEEKGREREDEDEEHATPKNQQGKVLPFPAPHPNADATQVARILKIPITEALTRLVAEYAPVSSLSLLGEADAAREWIDDSRKNRKRQRMSPAFFRRWLKRELEALERRQVILLQESTNQVNGTTGGAPPARDMPLTAGRRPPSLMHLAKEDQQAKGDTR